MEKLKTAAVEPKKNNTYASARSAPSVVLFCLIQVCSANIGFSFFGVAGRITDVKTSRNVTCILQENKINRLTCSIRNVAKPIEYPMIRNPKKLSLGRDGRICVQDSDELKCWQQFEKNGKARIEKIVTIQGLNNLEDFYVHDHRAVVLDDDGLKVYSSLEGWKQETRYNRPRKGKYPRLGIGPNFSFLWQSRHAEKDLFIEIPNKNGRRGENDFPLRETTMFTVEGPKVCVLANAEVTCRFFQSEVKRVPLINPRYVKLAHELGCALDDTGIVCFDVDRENNVYEVDFIHLEDPKTLSLDWIGRRACALNDSGVHCAERRSGEPWELPDSFKMKERNLDQEFDLVESLQEIAEISYKEKSYFYSQIAKFYDRQPSPEKNKEIAWLLLLEPFILNTNSEIFKNNVIPDFKTRKSLTLINSQDISLNTVLRNDNGRRALVKVLSIWCEALAQNLSLESKRELNGITKDMAFIIASEQIDTNSLKSLISGITKSNHLVEELEKNARLSPFLGLVDEYSKLIADF